jgi:hypothetical protein
MKSNHPANRQLSLLQIVQGACERKLIRHALIACSTGSVAGLFEAYGGHQLRSLELRCPGFRAGHRQQGMVIAQGWITDEDDRRFLETVGHFKSDHYRTPREELLSSHEAKLFVRKVLGGRPVPSVTRREAIPRSRSYSPCPDRVQVQARSMRTRLQPAAVFVA